MRTVADESGDRYLLVEQSSESWLVRDPETGDERHLPAAELRVLDGESPLETAAASAPDAVRDELPRLDDRALGLLVELAALEPVGVRTLLDSYHLCESDLHGLLAEFTAAGLIAETRVGGERGYETTADAAALLDEA